ncbi:MAG: manganese-dependent inorganic pyrophosphatase [Fusobacteriaceae bacterium]|jgi:manganese-dependent inorganic pyrophosphatase|nr:manganese-dependent inorganic pyrophosphatase [Fusobacteriaceae bacterium]MBP6467268.1 manganese-dependent inorganic pyrophosphatase [Fusobacteriaceae bacterium]MBP9596855.1 manganese-dependent inorganic pyrophosphatase [Fusobacteriaceae bacterium]
MSKILVMGHKNPDTDSICSAISYANLKKELGFEVEAVRLGTISKETQFILDYLNMDAPRLIESVNSGDQIILVDHNEAGQSVDGRDNATILEIIDHHKIDLKTSDPINLRFETVGCSSTIISKIYEEKGVAITKEMATVMLSAIMSDTLIFKSPTCTEEDVKQGKKLAEISGLDYEVYGKDLLIAGTSLDDKTAYEIVNIDCKPFEFGTQKAAVAQVNTVEISAVLARKEELETVMKELMAKDGLDFVTLMITDIITNSTELYVVGDKTLTIKTFGMSEGAETVFLPNVVSRKKQIVPPYTDMAK